MTGRSSRALAVAPLVYWLMVFGGLLAAHAVLERGSASRAAWLWAGAVGGTMLGQGAASRRVPFWVLALAVPVLLVLGIQITLAGSLLGNVGLLNGERWGELALGLLALLPALACGYASFSERGVLVAVWFPAALWSLGLLDVEGRPAFDGRVGAALLAVFAVLFVVYLLARESRRVALWSTHAAVRLAEPLAAELRLRPPARLAAQGSWILATSGVALVLTVWLAPHLWRTEKGPAKGLASSAGEALAQGDGPPCCPQPGEVELTGPRVREYFPLLEASPDTPPPSAGSCVACSDVRGETPSVGVTNSAGAPGNADASSSGVAPGPPGAAQATSALPSSSATQSSSSPPVPPSPVAAPPTPAPSTPLQHAAGAPPAPPAPRRPPPPAPAPALSVAPIPWLLTSVSLAVLLQLVLRPLRRLMTVRHLRVGLWAERLDQRVSNLWHLVLVGLRDAGIHPVPGEQPLALARRVGLPGAETCAVVLERARHGVRLEPSDVHAMEAAARTSFEASRRHLSPAVRLLGWLRSPLV